MNSFIRFLWALFLVTLPVTSFPYFPPAIGGEALVRPLAIYPLILLFLIAVLPALFRKPVPKNTLVLIPFVLVAVASSLLSLLRAIEPALGISVDARVLRGIFTLVIGCVTYLTLSVLPEKPEDLRFSLKWIYAGCGIALGWSSLQAINIIRFNPAWFDFLSEVQQYISIRRLLPDRISGLTYEPHWLAEQIVLLLVPGMLTSAISGYSIFKWRWHWVTVERVGILWGILVLPFTFSRAGLLNFLILVVVSSLLLGSLKKPLSNQPLIKNGKRLGKQIIRIVLLLVIVVIPIILTGTRNSFFSRIWIYWAKEDASLYGYLTSLGFDSRLAYGQAAFNTYEEHPFLGVGLGNYAFYLEDMLPFRPLAYMPEVLRVITPEFGRDRLVTSKNFYLRLLAETGVVGLIAFLAFIIAHIGIALWLWLSPNIDEKYWGAVSLIGLAAFVLTALTFDSFIIPNMWVVFGMISAAYRVFADTSRISPILIPITNIDSPNGNQVSIGN